MYVTGVTLGVDVFKVIAGYIMSTALKMPPMDGAPVNLSGFSVLELNPLFTSEAL